MDLLKVFIAEDESIVREGLRDMIPWEKYGFEFVGDAPDGEMALPMLHKVKPDMSRTSHFTVEDTCVGCGLCARNCPVSAIEIREKKPVWVKDECVMCLRCLHHCPKFAIQYGKRTKQHGQYTHPVSSGMG